MDAISDEDLAFFQQVSQDALGRMRRAQAGSVPGCG